MPELMTTETEIEQLTGRHWDKNDTGWYIVNLLPKEMAHSGQQREPCDVLVLLIGFSPDPLLQSIWKYQPQRVVLMLNNRYGNDWGSQRAERYREWIVLMGEQGLCPLGAVPDESRNDIAVCPTEASPDWVFRELRDRLLAEQRGGKRIIVDITGAKKNLSSGAFLFAAYAGVDISYVDFEKYDEYKRRPYGYTCRIELQPNPYQILGLRDWERVRKLYEQFAFRNAIEEVRRLEDEMRLGLSKKAGQGRYFTPEQCDAVARLSRVLGMLEHWDNGDFFAAWKLWSDVDEGKPALSDLAPNLPLPQAVLILGAKGWPSEQAGNAKSLFIQHRLLKRGDTKPEDSIFFDLDRLVTYAYDELDKIDQLIRFNNDYRSAFLRSAGLDELLLKARVAILWFKPSMTRPDWPDKRDRFHGIADHASADKLRDFLLGITTDGLSSTHELQVKYWDSTRKKIISFEFKCAYSTASKPLDPYWKGSDLDHETLVDLRGEAIHTHLSLPHPIAEAAHQVADSAMTDFVSNWAPLLGKSWTPYHKWELTWEALCTHSGVDFLPALNQQRSNQP